MTESALSIMIMKDGHRMKLYEGNIGATYRVKSVHVDEAINRRLEALGVNENTPLLVMNKKNSGTKNESVNSCNTMKQRIAAITTYAGISLNARFLISVTIPVIPLKKH